MNTHTHSDHDAHGQGSCCANKKPAPASDNTVIDPVCGMQVDPNTTSHHVSHAGTDYHFCSARCREKFVTDPER